MLVFPHDYSSRDPVDAKMHFLYCMAQLLGKPIQLYSLGLDKFLASQNKHFVYDIW